MSCFDDSYWQPGQCGTRDDVYRPVKAYEEDLARLPAVVDIIGFTRVVGHLLHIEMPEGKRSGSMSYTR